MAKPRSRRSRQNRSERPRAFEVYTHHAGGSTGRVIQEASVEAAAVAFIGEVGLALHGDEHRVSVFIRDIARNEEHCISIDLDAGLVRPCR